MIGPPWEWKSRFAKKAGETPLGIVLTVIMLILTLISIVFTFKACSPSRDEMYEPRTFTTEQNNNKKENVGNTESKNMKD